MAAFLAAVALLATYSGGEIDRLPTHAKVVALTFDAGGNDLGGREIRRGASWIRRVTGRDTRPLFRLPYGARDSRTIAIARRP